MIKFISVHKAMPSEAGYEQEGGGGGGGGGGGETVVGAQVQQEARNCEGKDSGIILEAQGNLDPEVSHPQASLEECRYLSLKYCV
uniref:Uncharacterized protein n=1 Tax=Lactuca sativa TaxID=4236 RepID=A0A9R1XV34_LACSA|nr:hypothetical protein LSAT_V11C100033220 [Lactuca sativa]